MPDITLNTLSFDDCTLGRLFIKGKSFFTLELPWKDNKPSISCIPPGIYKFKKRFSPNKQMLVIELEGVEGRTYIQIHIGNRTAQIEGCILPGTGIKDYNDDGIPDVVGSVEAFNKIMELAPENGTIKITRS